MPTRALSSSPSLALLYPRVLLGAGLAAARRLPGAPAASDSLPDEQLELADVEVDRKHLAAFERVCTFEVGEELPPTYPHLLAFPLSMQLMSAPGFPFPLMGLIHIANRIDQRRALRVDERPTLRVRTENLAPHDKGRQFEVAAEAEAGGEVVWRSVSTYLHREGGGGSSERSRDGDHEADSRAPVAEFAVAPDTGRRYAAVSGDRNPIHLHPLAARLFGLPGMIAHGMWAKSRCLAVLDAGAGGSLTVDVEFKLPLVLPARVALASWSDGDRRRLWLRDAASGRPHLEGTIA